jgi:excinuclease ABC subunit C
MGNLPEKVKKLTSKPGVYIFSDFYGHVIYVGKARNIKNRVKQYFRHNHHDGQKTEELIKNIDSIRTRETVSEFDALLLEAKLIAQYRPKYNVIAKDDKSPIYIHIDMSHTFPRINLQRKKGGVVPSRTHIYFGPFQSYRIAKQLLTNIRRIVPYCRERNLSGKPCFYTHVGLCNPCPSAIVKLDNGEEKKRLTAEYRHNIFLIQRLLEGRSLHIHTILKKKMDMFSRQKLYEKAAAMRGHIEALESLLSTHLDPSVYLSDEKNMGIIVQREISDLQSILAPYYPNLTNLHRIECYDISHTAGFHQAGSMVVLTDGVIDTSQYRRFAIKSMMNMNDSSMMYEIIRRRFGHTNWPLPDLVIVDGGIPQASQAMKAISEYPSATPCVGLAKRFESLIVKNGHAWTTIHISTTQPSIQILMRIRDESHRFAHRYHLVRRSRHFLV